MSATKFIERDSKLWKRSFVWPESDIHLWRNCNKPENGPAMLDNIMALVPNLNTKNSKVIQAGGACGVYADYYSKYFRQITTFEPDPDNYHCLAKNTKSWVVAINTALSDKIGNVPMHRSRINVGATRVGVGEDVVHYTAPAITIDMLAPPKSKLSISLIHLDVEGYEKSILMGGLKEIERCKPVIVLETWDDEFMKSIGYRDAGMVSPWDKAFVYNS